MPEDDPARVRVSRRATLALAGSVALAGCSALQDPLGDEQHTTIDGTRLQQVATAEGPSIPETVPVDVERAALDDARARAEDLLASVPVPLGPSEIPNGAIREELSRKYEEAEDELARATEAGSRFEAMERLRRARGDARAAATAWDSIDAGVTRSDLEADLPGLRDDDAAFRERRRYVGDDPVRAVVVHDAVEDLLERVQRRVSPDDEERRGREVLANPIAVGEFGGQLEEARAALDDAAYLYDRFEASLSTVRDLGPTFEAASASLLDDVLRRHDNLPSGDEPSDFVDADVEGTPAAAALEDLYFGIDHTSYSEERHAAGSYASVVLLAYWDLTEFRAFDVLRERVADGERFTVESADEVIARRQSAVEAVNAALADSAFPVLARHVVSSLAGHVRYADDELERVDDEVRVEWLDRELSHYVVTEAIADVLPATTEQVAEALDAA